MVNLRPVGYVIGLLTGALGLSMAVPLVADLASGSDQAETFAVSGLVTCLAGGLMMLANTEARQPGLTIQQAFLLTTLTWAVLPFFGALPFWIGAPEARPVDAYFEAMSGLTTTGSTVFSGLDNMPAGTLLWRGMLQWFGGIGIIVVALAFLPTLNVGGMQLFRSEAFDTFGKILPRAAEIAGSVAWVYLGITFLCFLSFLWAGMVPFDAIVHAFTTVSTGGFSTYDASIGHFPGTVEYVASIFMLMASLPFIRYVQLVGQGSLAILRDTQVRAFLAFNAVVVSVLVLWLLTRHEYGFEQAFREVLFNAISILSGTGFASVDYQLWGPFAVAIFFLIGLVGGCAGSTCCSAKIFRYQLMVSVIWTQIRRLYLPHGVFQVRFDGRTVTEDVLNSVIAFFVMFMLTLGAVAVALALTGLDPITAISGAATAVANVGPGLGPIIGPAGNFATLNDTAKWILSFAMLAGRLELISVYVLFTVAFWRV